MTTVVQSNWRNDVSASYAVAADWNPGVAPTYNSATFVEYDITIGGYATSGANFFTVMSSANEQIGYAEVNANATLDIAAGAFTVFSETSAYSNLYNFGIVEIDTGATMQFGAAGSPAGDSSEIFNVGKVVLNGGSLVLAGPWFGLFGSGKLKLNNGTILGATTGAGNTFQNETNVIVGSGTIGNGAATTGNSGLYLTNGPGGTINANSTTALILNTGGHWIENSGTVETTGAGGLQIDSNIQNDGEVIDAGSGALLVNGALLQGGGNVGIASGASTKLKNGQLSISGLLSIAAGGVLASSTGDTSSVGVSNTFVGDVISAVAWSAGTTAVANDSTLNLNGSLYGAGQLRLKGSSGPTTLDLFNGGASFYESGGLILSDSSENVIASNGAGSQLSNYSLLAGAGTIGDGFLRLYNAPTGVVDADDSLGLTLEGDSSAVTAGTESSNYNAGTIETTGSGGLTITGVLSNAGGLEAIGAGALTLNGAFINNGGGIVSAQGSGLIVLENNAQIYNQAYALIATGGTLTTTTGDTDDILKENVFNYGTLTVANGSVLVADGHWVNTGRVKIAGTTSAAALDIAAGQTLEFLGGGTVNLKGADSAILSAGAGTKLENRDGVIKGMGVIGDANMAINNTTNGLIDATGATALTIDATAYDAGTNSTYLYNSGTIQSDSAAGLTIETAMYSPGRLVANTGTIDAEDAVYGPGAATINGTGSIQFGAEADNNVTFGAGAKGSLALQDSAQFYGNVWGFAEGDTIDLRDFVFNSAGTKLDSTKSGFGALDGGIVLTNGSADSSAIYVEGNYSSAFLASQKLAFQFTSDGHEIGTTGTFGTDIKLVST